MNQISNPRIFVANAVGLSEPEAAAKTQEMTPRGAIWLAALGAASRMGVTQDEIGQIVQFLSQPSWGPSTSLIDEAVHDLVQESHLIGQPPLQGEPRFVPTVSGSSSFRRLMLTRIGHVPSPFGQACLRVKLAFIDLLAPSDRSQLLEIVARNYERELILRRNRRPPFQIGLFGQSWRDLETEHLRRDLVQMRTYAYAPIYEDMV
ncbi:MAG: hypothetical protein OEL53_13350 [Rhodospirillales bacterium]|nr:hypothetical protein [Rhodospirillales bacterium]